MEGASGTAGAGGCVDSQGLLFLSALPPLPTPAFLSSLSKWRHNLLHPPQFITCSAPWMAKLPASSRQTLSVPVLALG